MADTDYSIDLRTRSPFWARMASILTGGRLVTPEKGSQMAGTSAHGVVGESVVTDERNMQISTVWACIRLISTVTASLPLDVYEPIFTPADITGEADPERGALDGGLTVALLLAIQEVNDLGKTSSSAPKTNSGASSSSTESEAEQSPKRGKSSHSKSPNSGQSTGNDTEV